MSVLDDTDAELRLQSGSAPVEIWVLVEEKEGGGTVTEPCSVLHSGGDTIMLLLKRNEREHHSTSSPAIPSPRSQLKLNQMGKPPHLHSHTGSGAASPSQCIFHVDAVQMFANHPKAKKIFLLLISCSLRRFYFV